MVLMPLVLKQLQAWDQRRSGVPGEHWVTLGTGLALVQMAKPGRAPLLRVAAGVAGVALIWRAASGRDGFLRQLRSRQPSATDTVPRIEHRPVDMSSAP